MSLLSDAHRLLRAHRAVVAIVSTLAASVAFAGASPPASAVPAAGVRASSPGTKRALVVVILIDTTSSVTNRFREDSLVAVADAIPRLVAPGRGRVEIYVRKIDHSPGTDGAAVAKYHIDPVFVCTDDNPFNQHCRNRERVSLAHARGQARTIASQVRALRLPRGRAGTVIRGAFAAASQIFANANGDKWMVVASDLRPSHSAPPRPRITLKRVHVVVLFACRQPIAICQTRQRRWGAELVGNGAVRPVTFLSSQQGDLLFRR